MKQLLIAIVMVLTLSLNANASAQKHRHTPRTEQVDSTKNNHDAIEAFSDTTSVADADNDQEGCTSKVYSDEDVKGVFEQVFGGLDGQDLAGMFFVLFVLLILFVLAPISIIVAIFYFVNRNKSERYKLAQLAMKSGQPIPDQLLKEQRNTYWDKNEFQSGVRQVFTGIGLAIFLGIIIGKLGIGIGALVFFIGLGKVVMNWKSGNPFDRNANEMPQANNNSEEISND